LRHLCQLFQLAERLTIGRVSNMQEIVEVISSAGKAIYV